MNITEIDVEALADSQPSDSGAYRKVFDLGSHVLKVDGKRGSVAGCQNEAELWATANEEEDWELVEILCPVIAFGTLDDGRSWLVMAKAELLDTEEKYAYDATIDDYNAGGCVCAECQEYSDDWSDPQVIDDWSHIWDLAEENGLRDIHSGNVGFFEGRRVLIDYAL